MMVRTQISIDSALLARVRARASAHGISLAEYFRRLVDRDLDESSAKVRRSVVFDLGASGGADISTDKDRMIAEAIGAKKLGTRRRSSRN